MDALDNTVKSFLETGAGGWYFGYCRRSCYTVFRLHYITGNHSSRNRKKDKARLLEQIDMIYADFDYPEDMDSSISYMPVYDEFFSSSRTIEDNRNYLLSKLDNFIEEQQKKYQLEIK